VGNFFGASLRNKESHSLLNPSLILHSSPERQHLFQSGERRRKLIGGNICYKLGSTKQFVVPIASLGRDYISSSVPQSKLTPRRAFRSRGDRRTRVHGARVEATIWPAIARSRVCKPGAARSNCHMLMLSHLAAGRGKAASMPAAARPRCIIQARDLGCWRLFLACAVGHVIY
jgi:hypothetical protein